MRKGVTTRTNHAAIQEQPESTIGHHPEEFDTARRKAVEEAQRSEEQRPSGEAAGKPQTATKQ